MFPPRICCAFGTEGYFGQTQAIESFGGCAVTESFDDK